MAGFFWERGPSSGRHHQLLVLVVVGRCASRAAVKVGKYCTLHAGRANPTSWSLALECRNFQDHGSIAESCYWHCWYADASDSTKAPKSAWTTHPFPKATGLRLVWVWVRGELAGRRGFEWGCRRIGVGWGLGAVGVWVLWGNVGLALQLPSPFCQKWETTQT